MAFLENSTEFRWINCFLKHVNTINGFKQTSMQINDKIIILKGNNTYASSNLVKY